MLQYAQWYSQKTGVEWTLPTFLEWEKAARGVDGRSLPWGEYFEPTWACVRGSKEGKSLPASIFDHPLDCSPYGVFGLAGNAQDLCYSPETPDKVYIKGGAWAHHSEFINMAIHRPFTSNIRLEVCGFRLIHRHKK
jgi:serine/threonine-protein kinase